MKKMFVAFGIAFAIFVTVITTGCSAINSAPSKERIYDNALTYTQMNVNEDAVYIKDAEHVDDKNYGPKGCYIVTYATTEGVYWYVASATSMCL